MPVKNSSAYERLLADVENDISKQQEEQSLSAAELLKRKKAKEARRMEEIRAAASAAFEIEEAAKKRRAEEEEERRTRVQREKERRAREAAEAYEREMERKTKTFFKVGRYNKHMPTGVVYFGDHTTIGGAWVPHGYGEFRFSGDTIFEGEFFQGEMHGLGQIKFENDDVWKGTFRHDDMHGFGVFKFAGNKVPPRESIYRRSKRVCWLDDLVPGTRIRFMGPHHAHRPTGTILFPTSRRCKFRVRFDQAEALTLDFAEEHFEIVQSQPRCAMLELFNMHGSFDQDRRYDYRQDQRQPATTTYEENFFQEPRHQAQLAANKAAAEEKERYKEQTNKMKSLLAATAHQNKIKADMAAGLAAEREKQAKEAADAAEYEAKVQAQRDALLKSREEEAKRMKALR